MRKKQIILKIREKRHITHRRIKIRMAANFHQKQCKWEDIGTKWTEKKIVDLPLYTQGKYFSNKDKLFKRLNLKKLKELITNYPWSGTVVFERELKLILKKYYNPRATT